MKFIQLCRSQKFELSVKTHCHQSGTFALITTGSPTSTETRLNDGWCYWGGPRNGTKSPPLAYSDDWKVSAEWCVSLSVDVERILGAVRIRFDRPCIIAQIEDRLMKDDNAQFSDLGAKGMSKNGLDNVFVLKRGDYPEQEGTTNAVENHEKDVIFTALKGRIQSIIEAHCAEIGEIIKDAEEG